MNKKPPIGVLMTASAIGSELMRSIPLIEEPSVAAHIPLLDIEETLRLTMEPVLPVVFDATNGEDVRKATETIIAFIGSPSTSSILRSLVEERDNFTFVDSSDSLAGVHKLMEDDPKVIICHEEEEAPNIDQVLKNRRIPMTKTGILASIVSRDVMLEDFVESIMQDDLFKLDMSLFDERTHPVGMKHCKKIDKLKRTQLPARKPMFVRRTHP